MPVHHLWSTLWHLQKVRTNTLPITHETRRRKIALALLLRPGCHFLSHCSLFEQFLEYFWRTFVVLFGTLRKSEPNSSLTITHETRQRKGAQGSSSAAAQARLPLAHSQTLLLLTPIYYPLLLLLRLLLLLLLLLLTPIYYPLLLLLRLLLLLLLLLLKPIYYPLLLLLILLHLLLLLLTPTYYPCSFCITYSCFYFCK